MAKLSIENKKSLDIEIDHAQINTNMHLNLPTAGKKERVLSPMHWLMTPRSEKESDLLSPRALNNKISKTK